MLAEETERAILALAQGSEADLRAAGERLVGALAKPVYRLCLHLTGHRADAEDATQDTLLAACRARFVAAPARRA